MGLGECSQAGADGGKAVSTGGREVFQEVEGGEGIGVAGGDFSGRGVVEEICGEDDQTAHEGRVGVGVKIEAAVAHLRGNPDGRDAAGDAVFIGAGDGWQRGTATGAVDDHRETFLEVVDEREVGGEQLKFFGEGHGRKAWGGLPLGARHGNGSAGAWRKRGGKMNCESRLWVSNELRPRANLLTPTA